VGKGKIRHFEKVAILDPKWPPKQLLYRIHSLNGRDFRHEIWYDCIILPIGYKIINECNQRHHLESKIADPKNPFSTPFELDTPNLV